MSKLYLVGTPIGNMADITFRAVEVLKEVDIIACEDTRHTLPLLQRYGIKKPLVSYYKQKEREGSVYLAELVEGGKNVALVSDAGMPCISDPGAVAVREFMRRGLEYTVIPGANAAVCAAALAGIEGAFTFLGFLPEKSKDRTELIKKHAFTGANLIIYAAPHDVNKIAEFLYSELGERKVYLIKEITKIYERARETYLSSFSEENPKGEYVLVVCPSEEKEISDGDILNALNEKIFSGKDKKTAVTEAAAELSVNKNRVYKLSLSL